MRQNNKRFDFEKAQQAIRAFERGIISKKRLELILAGLTKHKKSYQQVIHLTK
jgi:hypothetical protein